MFNERYFSNLHNMIIPWAALTKSSTSPTSMQFRSSSMRSVPMLLSWQQLS